jgi:hypothetical protein
MAVDSVSIAVRAEILLPRIREWMNANSWIVNEAVLPPRDDAVPAGRASFD